MTKAVEILNELRKAERAYKYTKEEVNEAIDQAIKAVEQQPCDEDVLKFYYVESLDDYWIGERLDTMYYAEWDFELQSFVWTHSKYLPWGEHVVAPNTLWKEYTYPSEPKEIPFAEWIKGFLKKHGREQQPCENCISREAVIEWLKDKDIIKMNYQEENAKRELAELPSVTPQPKIGKWIFHKPFDIGQGNCNECIECSYCRIWLNYDYYDKTPYCPICGAKMEVAE